MPNRPMHAAITQPQYRRSASVSTPPGSDTTPETTSLVDWMLATATLLPPSRRSRTSGRTTMKLWAIQWNTPWPLVRPPIMKAAVRRKPVRPSTTAAGAP